MSDLLSTCEWAVKRGLELGAEDVEVLAIEGREANVSIERNDVKIGKSQVSSGVGIRVFKEKSLGFASVNTLAPREVESALKKAISLASFAPSDMYNDLPSAEKCEEVKGLFDPMSSDFHTENALEYAVAMLETARDYDPRVTIDVGSFSADVGERAIANSRGISLTEKRSTFFYDLLGMAEDGNQVSCMAYRFHGTHKVRDVDVEKVGNELAEDSIKSLGARKVRSFRGPMLLSPIAVYSLIAYLISFSVNSNNVQKGMSRFTNKLGRKVASEALSVTDDGTLEGGLVSSSFDREGQPHSPLNVIKRGELVSFLYNTHTAKKEGRASTGHAAGDISRPPRISPTNFILEPGEKKRDEMIDEMEKGVIVGRYSGVPSMVSGDFSGVVKGGFLVKNGEILHPVRETMVAGNVFEVLGRISEVSKEREQVVGYILPYVRIEDVSITGG